MATIKQIAQQLHVSETTLYNVINNRSKRVSKETAARIREALDAMGYVPNMGARMLVRKSSHIIGVICCTMTVDGKAIMTFDNPYGTDVLGMLAKLLYTKGYYMMVHFTNDVDEIVRLTREWNIDGMIIYGETGPLEMELSEKMANSEIPIVCMSRHIKKNLNFSSVGIDDQLGGYMVGKHLIERGHRKIGYLCDGSIKSGYRKHRYYGFCQALSEAGIEVEDHNCIQLCIHDKAERRARYDQVIREKKYTALFFASDYLAVEAMIYFQDQGFSVPEDISIVGFDDAKLATCVRPKLTTVRQDIASKAIKSCELLMEMLENPTTESQNVLLPIQLIQRDSVKNILI